MWKSPTNLIRWHISKLPEGAAFTTRDLLGYGFRAAVDQVLCRLVKSGMIRRIARGIFVRDPNNLTRVCSCIVARIKAQCFQRQIAKHAQTTIKEFCGQENYKPKTIYLINSKSSSFKIDETMISLKGSCARKAALSETKVGERVNALWSIGKENLTADMIREAMACVSGGESRLWLRKNIFLLPAWLADRFMRRETFRNVTVKNLIFSHNRQPLTRCSHC